MPEYYIHWTSGHKRGCTSLAYNRQEVDRIERRYLAEYPDMVFELVLAKEA